jgi:TPR repeat protein
MAQAMLGNMHYDGEGGPQDFAEASRLFRLAVAQGHVVAQAMLGCMYHQGHGVCQNTFLRRGGCLNSLQRKATQMHRSRSAACTTMAKVGRKTLARRG